MIRIKLTIQYKGTNYHGWQVQPNGVTVQEVLQKTLSKILDQKITVIGAGRTDAGVHALGQVCHFDLPKDVIASPSASLRAGSVKQPRWDLVVPTRLLRRHAPRNDTLKLCRGLNSLLPPDISVVAVEPVSEKFHAQKSAKKKIYEYHIHNSPIRSPFLHEYSWQVPYLLDIKKMKMAAKLLAGKHDFRAFCASGSSVKTTVRRVHRIVVRQETRGKKQDKIWDYSQLITISITGSGFLKQMVRNIVGTLTDVGRGKIPPSQVKKILQSCDRKLAGPTAPAKGLFLKSVIY